MVNAQEWLDKWYPKNGGCLRETSYFNNFNKKRSEIMTWLDISRQNLVGSLDLSDFSRLKYLYCFHNQLTQLNVRNCSELWSLDCAGNPALTNLDLEPCRKLEYLICNKNQLEGKELDVSKFPKLKEYSINWTTNAQTWLDQNYPIEGICLRETDDKRRYQEIAEKIWYKNKEEGWNNQGKTRSQITKLDIRNQYLEGSLILDGFANLQELNCSNNYLTELTIDNCSQLEGIDCKKNNLSNLDLLTTLSQSVNLEYLYISNNNFTGSLVSLQNLIKLKNLDISHTNLNSEVEYLPESLEEIKYDTEDRPNCKLSKIKDQLDQKYWRDIHKDFQPKDKKEWIEQGFNKEETNQWIQVGLKPNEYNFANYLKNERNLTSLQVKANLSELKKDYENFLIAKQSEEKINQFIQKANLTRIPYQQLSNIEYLAEGGFGKIYQAEWEEKGIILKSLNNSSQLTTEFLKEIASHKLFESDKEERNTKEEKKETNVVKCHGISQDPETGNYLMVMDYVRGGNLRKYLQKNNPKLNFKKKIIQLHSIAEGLKNIHEKGLIHKDFHSGNILSSGSKHFFSDLKCHITDLGLCKPASEKEDENKIYGVMPYVAPEVLQSKPYTRKSDVYSFGMVAYEILSGQPPYYEQAYNLNLALKICEGSRPQFQIRIPQLLADLIKKCWDNNPSNRPESSELEKSLSEWLKEVNNLDSDIYQQIQEAEVHNQTLPAEVRDGSYNPHPQAVMHSKLINTKEITQRLEDINYSENQIIDFTNLEQKNTEFERSQTEISSKKTELIEQLKLEEKNLQRVQTRIQQLKTQIKELEEKELEANKLKSIHGDSKQIDLEILQELSELNIQEQFSLQAKIQIPPK